MSAFVNYPLTASDDDEFFDAPPGSFLLNSDGQITHKCVNDDYGWETSFGHPVQAGAVWASLAPGSVLRVPLWFAEPRDMTEGGVAVIEARAEARVAAWMAGAA